MNNNASMPVLNSEDLSDFFDFFTDDFNNLPETLSEQNAPVSRHSPVASNNAYTYVDENNTPCTSAPSCATRCCPPSLATIFSRLLMRTRLRFQTLPRVRSGLVLTPQRPPTTILQTFLLCRHLPFTPAHLSIMHLRCHRTRVRAPFYRQTTWLQTLALRHLRVEVL